MGSQGKWALHSASMRTTTGKQVNRASSSWEYCLHDYNSVGDAVVEVHLSAVFSHVLYQFKELED